MASSENVNVTLDPVEFNNFIRRCSAWYEDHHSFPTCVVLCDELEGLIENQFFKGKMTDLVSYRTDHKGKIRMHLNGIRAKFTPKLDMFRSVWVLDKSKPADPAGPVCPKTGPGSFPTGGTPMAMAA